LIEKAMRLNPRYPAWYVHELSVAYRIAGRYEEALTQGKRLLMLSPNYGGAHFNLAIIYSELGRMEEARAEVATMLRRVPDLSLEKLRQSLPFKNPADLKRYLNALRKAGLN
jgi:adenylate cyclase